MLAGISLGILVIEAQYRSGTSVTAKLATNQGRKVFVLPHEIGDINGVGTNKLIRKGATLVTSTRDIIEEFEFLQYKEPVKKGKKIETSKKEQKRINSNIEKIKNKDQKEIYKLIQNGANTVTEIYAKSNKTISEINNIILMLEIEGYIAKKTGGYICI